jgi:hypothetical protein
VFIRSNNPMNELSDEPEKIMSEPENSANCLKTKTNWAFAMSIISLALNVILITALIVGISCHKKRHHEGFRHGFGGGPGMQCPMMGGPGGPGGFKKFGGPGFERPGFGKDGGPGERREWGGPGGENRGQRMLDRLTTELSLDAGQQAKIKQIFDDQKAQIEKLGDQRTPDAVKKILEDGKAKIRAVLKPDQQKKFDDMAAKFGPKRNPEQK